MMLLETTSEVEMAKTYPIQYLLTGCSSAQETEISELWDWSLSIMMTPRLSKARCYQNLFAQFEIDLSSARPSFEIRTETFPIAEVAREVLPEEMLDYDIVVSIPPKNRYVTQLRVGSRRRAEPRVVEPVGFYLMGEV